MKKIAWLLLLALTCSLAWAFSKEDSPIQQQTMSGYVLRGVLWQDSTQTAFTTSWPTTALPDSVVLTLQIPSCQIEGAMDSVIVVYRPTKAVVPASAQKGEGE